MYSSFDHLLTIWDETDGWSVNTNQGLEMCLAFIKKKNTERKKEEEKI